VEKSIKSGITHS